MIGFRTPQVLLLMAGAACSTEFTPEPPEPPKPCTADSDCGAGLVCEKPDQTPVCVRAEDAPILIGQSAPATGANQALGTGMKLGIDLAFDEQNTNGGIRGRQLQLVFRDDSYQPDLAEAATRALIDVQVSSNAVPSCPSTASAIGGSTPVSMTALTRGENAVLAILGNVGTPTMVRAAPVAVETKTIFFGAFTGSSTLLRDMTAGNCRSYIFNVRASYAQEARATMEYFRSKGIADHRHLISFDQLDSFGQSGYDGLLTAYKDVVGPFPSTADQTTPIFRVRYVRDVESSVPQTAELTEAYLGTLLDAQQSGPVTVGILMTDTYGPATAYIQALRTWQYDPTAMPAQLDQRKRLRLLFSNVSFVGANALADRLKALPPVPGAPTMSFTDNVVISQVVPNYQDDTSMVVTAYNTQIAKKGATPSFTSLEGYISARVFIAGLLQHPGPFVAGDPDAKLVHSFESLPELSLGLGATSNFSATNHQYSSSVWGTALKPDGSFQNLYFWSQDHPIQFVE